MLTYSAESLRDLRSRITLVFSLPRTQPGLTATTTLLSELLSLTDSLTSRKFRPEVSKKLKSTRAEALTRFTKSLAALEEQPTQQELAQKKRAERERTERERVGKLSAEEQRKFVERERKAGQRKGQKVSRK